MADRRILTGFGYLLFILGFFLALEMLVTTDVVTPLVLSRPSRVALRLWQDAGSEELWQALLTTVREVLAALALTLAIGTSLGYAFYRFGAFGAAAKPVLVAFYSAPAILLYPVFLTVLGQGSATVVTMAVILGVAPIVINMAAGFGGIEPIFRKVGRSLQATRIQLLTHILIPAAMPMIVTGIRVGMTFALIGAVSLEFLTYSGGLGRLISWRYYIFDTEGVYSAIMLVVVIAITINAGLTVLERKIRNHWS